MERKNFHGHNTDFISSLLIVLKLKIILSLLSHLKLCVRRLIFCFKDGLDFANTGLEAAGQFASHIAELIVSALNKAFGGGWEVSISLKVVNLQCLTDILRYIFVHLVWHPKAEYLNLLLSF